MERPLTQHIKPGQEPLDLAGYEQAGGYQAVRKALRQMTPDEVTQVVQGGSSSVTALTGSTEKEQFA